MPTPLDLARVICTKREKLRIEEAEEISINNHFVFENCEHHCSQCCPWFHIRGKNRL